jgi:hypothetical protein
MLFLVALVGLPILGLPLVPTGLLRKLHLGAVCGVAGVIGAVLLCTEMLFLTWAGVRWKLWVLILPSAGLATVRLHSVLLRFVQALKGG